MKKNWFRISHKLHCKNCGTPVKVTVEILENGEAVYCDDCIGDFSYRKHNHDRVESDELDF